jgi:ketosteroid isomerase-like protein
VTAAQAAQCLQINFSSAEWAHPDIEVVIADGPAPGRWIGQAGMAEGARGIFDAWEGYRVGADEYRELDGERVLVLVHQGGRGKTSGLEIGRVRAKGASLFHVRDGKVGRYFVYFDRERAFADLGLASEADAAGPG